MMWLSRRLAAHAANVEPLDGVVTIGGANPAVTADGEKRELRILAPGGFGWSPRVEDAVVLYGDGVVAGMTKQPPVSLAPGEVCLYADGASVTLRNGGTIECRGNLQIQGVVRITGSLFLNGAAITPPRKEAD